MTAESSPQKRSTIPDPTFNKNESLYRACRKDHIMENENRLRYVPPDTIRFPFSVNRSKYSEPRHVLEHPKRQGWGVAEIKVGEIPKDVIKFNKTTYNLQVDHKPKPDNYAHSEIRIYKNGRYDEKVKSKKVKTKFRIRLSEVSRVIVEPQI